MQHDMWGKRFGSLVVALVSPSRNKSNRQMWVCDCDCGASQTVLGRYLKSGKIASCTPCKWKRSKTINNYEIIYDAAGAYVAIELTQGKWATADISDWFGFLIDRKWMASRCGGSYYAIAQSPRSENGPKRLYMHRAVLGIEGASVFGDHKNHDTLNNRKNNLRPCSQQQNSMNSRIRKSNTSGFIGVSNSCGKWVAHININGALAHVGSFETIEAAARARDLAAAAAYGEFAVLNLPRLECAT